MNKLNKILLILYNSYLYEYITIYNYFVIYKNSYLYSDKEFRFFFT